MKYAFNWKKALAAICVLALFACMLPASVFAEEAVEIPDSDYIYVNGDSKVDVVDATLIQEYVADLSVQFPIGSEQL